MNPLEFQDSDSAVGEKLLTQERRGTFAGLFCQNGGKTGGVGDIDGG